MSEISNLCRGRPKPDMKNLRPALPVIANVLKSDLGHGRHDALCLQDVFTSRTIDKWIAGVITPIFRGSSHVTSLNWQGPRASMRRMAIFHTKKSTGVILRSHWPAKDFLTWMFHQNFPLNNSDFLTTLNASPTLYSLT